MVLPVLRCVSSLFHAVAADIRVVDVLVYPYISRPNSGGTFASGSHVIKYVVEYLIAVIKNYLSELYWACGSSALHRTVGTTGNAPKYIRNICMCVYVYM